MQSQWRSRSDWNVGWRLCVRYGTGSAATGTSTARTMRAMQRQHRARPADAVEADDVRPGIRQHPAAILRRHAVARDRFAMDGHRDRGPQSRGLDDLERELRLRAIRERLGDHVVDAGLRRPLDLLLEHRAARRDAPRHRRDRRRSCCRCRRRRARRSRRRPALAICERLPVHRLELMLAADDRATSRDARNR